MQRYKMLGQDNTTFNKSLASAWPLQHESESFQLAMFGYQRMAGFKLGFHPPFNSC